MVAFDALWSGGKNIMSLPILERRRHLSEILQLGSKAIERIGYEELDLGDPAFPKRAVELFNASKQRGCEGLMIKTANESTSVYDTNGSRKQWVKVRSVSTSQIAQVQQRVRPF